jgi:hypothetical protein
LFSKVIVTSPDSGSARHRGAGHVGARTDFRVRGDLHFRVGGQERYAFAILADEDIGQNRHSVPTLDNTTHDLQWPE